MKVCANWRNDYLQFKQDMGEAPPGAVMVLYPNPEGDFEPGNCQWMTRKDRLRLLPIRKPKTRQRINGRAQLVGQRFGKLEVIAFAGVNKHSSTTWLTRCDCGTEKVFSVGDLTFKKGRRSCGCDRGERQRGIKRKSVKGTFRCFRCKKMRPTSERGPETRYYRCIHCPVTSTHGSDLAVATKLVRRARVRAEKLGIPFDLKPEDLTIPKYCPVLGLELKISHYSQGDTTIHNSYSLDRIIPEKGYVRGNVAVISNRANTLKRDGTLSEFRSLLAWLESLKCNQREENK